MKLTIRVSAWEEGFEVECSYSPGRPATMYQSNGDPGDPEEPEELEILKVTLVRDRQRVDVTELMRELDAFEVLEEEVYLALYATESVAPRAR